MNAKFCLPIIAKSKKEVLKKISGHKDKYDLFEVWLSQIKEPFPVILNLVQNLSDKLNGKLILVFRNPDGDVTMDKDKRQEIISLCKNSKVLIDVDLENQNEDLRFIKENNLKIKTILSCHNYEETPHNLIEILDRIEKENPEIIKIATKCNSNADAIKLLGLLLHCKTRNLKCIILGMGNSGVATRVFGSLWGNEIIFAPFDKKEASAPGQLTLEQLKNVFDILK